MKRNPTINDVAQLANVSRGTVSNYINGITIREENKAKIEKAIAELKYVPNARARELKTSKTSTVVLIVPTTWSPFFAELVYRMQVELDRIGFKMILANSHADPDEEEEILRMASLNQVTGVITMSYSNIYNFINIGKKLNLVSIERFISEDVPLITSDNYGGGQLAAEKLITFGSKRFLLLRRKTNHYNATDKRTEGFLHIMKENNLPVDIFEASLKENYIEERLWATAPDGVKVPISLVYRKDIVKNGQNPLLLYGYGSYGVTINPYFSTTRLSLLDRGFIYAIAHIRGGEYLGRQWYEDGKLLKKKNTFTDFIACSQYLIAEGYTSPKHLFAEGGSAGGLLMGAVVNMAPQLYKGIIASVPFVDVVTTMLDDSIPLTTGEYDEWGNPNVPEYYEYMLSYSPYDQVRAQSYPAMYVSTGLHDSQVQYWEPAKWVAKLRELKTDDHPLYLDTNMEAGHGGASGRFEALKETAKEYAFLLTLHNQ